VFSTLQAQLLVSALNEQRGHESVARFLERVNPAAWGSPTAWVLGAPAVSPDGQAVYFATNLGTGQGPSGNTASLVFRFGVADGHTTALGRLGPILGRRPEIRVSPDGTRLLVVTSAHSSAIDNSVYAYAVELATERSVELAMEGEAARGRANLVSGFCWLADSRSVALSATYYTVQDIVRAGASEIRDEDFDLYVKSTITGGTLRRVEGARSPSCSEH